MPWDRTARPRNVAQCEPGFFLVRFAKGGVEVACRIVQWGDGAWQAVVNGEPRDADADWARARDVPRIWLGGREITEEEYDSWLAWAEHVKRHEPDHPAANPHRKVDFRRMRP